MTCHETFNAIPLLLRKDFLYSTHIFSNLFSLGEKQGCLPISLTKKISPKIISFKNDDALNGVGAAVNEFNDGTGA